MVENDDYAKMLRRMVKSYGHRLAAGDVEDLAAALELVHELNHVIGNAITAGRATDPEGWSWTNIGRAAGTTRQAAQQRWGKK